MKTIALLLLASLAGAAPLVGTQDLQPNISIATLTVSGSVSGQLTIAGSTLTVTGQDANGYSVNLSSSIKTGGCVTFGALGSQCKPAGAGTGDVVAAGNNAFLGNNTYAGSETFNGSVVANNLIHNIVLTNNFAASTTQTSFNTCFATVTITTAASDRLRVNYAGQLFNDTSGRFACLSFLLDGAYDTTLGARIPIVCQLDNDTNVDGSFSWVTSVQNAGTHNICFTLAVNTGTGKACNSVPADDTFTTATCQFSVEEVK